MTQIYRNVYIKNGIPRFKGKDFLFYSGKIYTNAENTVTNSDFDRNVDIYLSCTCDAKRFKGLVKTKEK